MKPTRKILLGSLAILTVLLSAGCATGRQDPKVQIYGDSDIRFQSTVR